MIRPPPHILPIIVVSQFAGTSLWFATNAVLGDLQAEWGLEVAALGYLTSAVQLGFICGTFVFAVLALPDRYSPRLIFCLCSLLGAAANLLSVVRTDVLTLAGLRFATGVFLAGIYPVGMKIAAGWYRAGLGNALGFLVGALVLGTALPHLLKAINQTWPWQAVVSLVSVAAVAGGLLMLILVPDGPYTARTTRPFSIFDITLIFRSRRFRASAFGYFGHMWELYAFWAFVPYALSAHMAGQSQSFWVFAIIGVGAIGCMAGGALSARVGSAKVAFAQLSASAACCLFSPLFLGASTTILVLFLILWGVTVVGDSPQFSALNAANAPAGLVGSALTIANCLGFAITIGSIQLLSAMIDILPREYLYVLLAPGPLLGLLAMRSIVSRAQE